MNEGLHSLYTKEHCPFFLSTAQLQDSAVCLPTLSGPSLRPFLPAKGDDRSTAGCVAGGKLTLGPGDVGHQEDVGEWQGGH